MPIAIQEPKSTIETLKAALASTSINTTNNADSSLLTSHYSSFDATPSTGTEFRAISTDGKPILTIRDILNKEFVHRLGLAGGKPHDPTLHVHPLTQAGTEYGDEISVISNEYVFGEKFGREKRLRVKGDSLWHADITFEVKPSDYASLQIRTFPAVGGDTLWASAYEAYDRLSPYYQQFLESLTATHSAPGFVNLAKASNVLLRSPRGSPDNKGQELETSHPVISNPVTGWKGLFVNRGFTKKINELHVDESEALLDFLFAHIASNHDLQARFRWEPNNLAIWDNRSAFHAATYDLGNEQRIGTRSVSIGEAPYFDPKSISRREALDKAARVSK